MWALLRLILQLNKRFPELRINTIPDIHGAVCHVYQISSHALMISSINVQSCSMTTDQERAKQCYTRAYNIQHMQIIPVPEAIKQKGIDSIVVNPDCMLLEDTSENRRKIKVCDDLRKTETMCNDIPMWHEGNCRLALTEGGFVRQVCDHIPNTMPVICGQELGTIHHNMCANQCKSVTGMMVMGCIAKY